MSVLVKRLRSPTIEVYVKGAPEVMREICRPDTSKPSFPLLYTGYFMFFSLTELIPLNFSSSR